MKRKIAILLSALMVTTALPMNASAATIKSASTESGVRPGTSTVGKYLDTDSENATSVRISNITKDKLTKDRFQRANADFKIENDSKGDKIEAGTSFIIELKNGKFPEGNYKTADGKIVDNFQDLFGYVAFDAEGNKYKTNAAGHLVYAEDVKSKNEQGEEVVTHKVGDLVVPNDEQNYEKAINAIAGDKVIDEISGTVGAETADAVGAVTVDLSQQDLQAAFDSTNSITQGGKLNIKFNFRVTPEGVLTIETPTFTLSDNPTIKLTGLKENDQIVSKVMYNGLIAAYEARLKELEGNETTNPIKKAMSDVYVPYTITRESDTTAKVTIGYDISDAQAKGVKVSGVKNNYDSQMTIQAVTAGTGTETEYKLATNKHIFGDTYQKDPVAGNNIFTTTGNKEVKPKISIPFGGVEVTEAGDVSISTKSYYGSTVSATSNFVVGKASADTETETIIGEVKTFEDKLNIDNLTIKEVIRGSVQNDTIKLRLSNGFIFASKDVKVNGKGSGFDGLKAGKISYGSDNGILNISLKDGQSRAENGAFFSIEGLSIISEDDNMKSGEVKLTISGAGITTQTITVGKKSEVGFKLETLEDPKEIVSGRYWSNDSTKSMEKEDNLTVKFKFSEKIPNSLLNQRNLDFVLPEGIKIVGFKPSKSKDFTISLDEEKAYYENDAADTNKDFSIVNGGSTLRLGRIIDQEPRTNSEKAGSFEGELELSVDPNFEGDITLSVEGGGQALENTKPVVIAKAVKPVKIKTKVTDINMGYQEYSVADIMIEETKAGMFLEGGINLTIVAPYGDQELAISGAKVEVSGDELKIEDGSKYDKETKAFNIKVKRSSYDKPATITVKDVKIGSTRSVPFGSYDLKVAGDAIVNNDGILEADIVENTKVVKAKKESETIDFNTDAYTQEYVNVVTATNTESLDKKVELKVGEKVVVVDGKEMEMDVASYIQSGSDSLMVPLRFVSGALLGIDGKEMDTTSRISFDNNTKVVTIYYGSGAGQKMIQFQAGSNVMSINGTKINMEYGVKAEIKNGRTFVPYRALGQALGAEVFWDDATRTAGYNTDVSKKEKAETEETKKEEVKTEETKKEEVKTEETKTEETKTEETKTEETKTEDSKTEEVKTDK